MLALTYVHQLSTQTFQFVFFNVLTYLEIYTTANLGGMLCCWHHVLSLSASNVHPKLAVMWADKHDRTCAHSRLTDLHGHQIVNFP